MFNQARVNLVHFTTNKIQEMRLEINENFRTASLDLKLTDSLKKCVN